MLEALSNRVSRGRDVFAAMPTNRKILIAGGAAAVLAGFIALFLWTNRTVYSVLYAGLAQEDAGAIVEKLSEQKVPYKLSVGGTTIEVPKDRLEETRLNLATLGLPTGGSVGMEVFNQTKIGETEFIQQLNLQRALQGELERTIKKFPEVADVRIHLSIPRPSLFIEEDRPPSASVVLKLNRGRSLSKPQLAGIVHLVASSIQGMTADNITVVDTDGGLLYSTAAEAEGGLLSATQVELLRDVENRLNRRLTSMLETVLGPDKAMARVNAELNYQQVTANEEIFDPDRTSIRSEQRLKETNVGAPRGAEGIPQSTFELGTGNQGTGAGAPRGEQYQRTEDTTNYEITKINRQIVSPAGEVKRLSVAVLVDYKPELDADGKPTGNFVPMAQNEVTQLEDLVKNAIGYNAERGDSVLVSSIPFNLPKTPPRRWYDVIFDYLRENGRQMFNILLIVLFFLFVVRPVVAWLTKATAQPEPEPETPALPGGAEAAEGALPDMRRGEAGQLTREQVIHLAHQDPERTLNLLRSWIDEA